DISDSVILQHVGIKDLPGEPAGRHPCGVTVCSDKACERTMSVGDHGAAGPIIYVDRSDVHRDRWDELKAAIRSLWPSSTPTSRRWLPTVSTSMRTLTA